MNLAEEKRRNIAPIMLHEFIKDDYQMTILNEAAYKKKTMYTEYDGKNKVEKDRFDEHTKGMEGQILYYEWYAGPLAGRIGFISVDENGIVTEHRLMGIS